MTKELKRVFNIFLIWQEDKEERWLREMALKGWHLIDFTVFMYIFIKGDPEDYVYKLDYKVSCNSDLPEYINIFQEAGWEHVTQFLGWHYFRTKAEGSRTPDIYSDNESRIQKYQSLLYVIYVVTFANVFNIINMFFGTIDIFPYAFNAYTIIRIISLGLFGLLGYSIYRIKRKINDLKDKL